MRENIPKKKFWFFTFIFSSKSNTNKCAFSIFYFIILYSNCVRVFAWWPEVQEQLATWWWWWWTDKKRNGMHTLIILDWSNEGGNYHNENDEGLKTEYFNLERFLSEAKKYNWSKLFLGARKSVVSLEYVDPE